MKKLHRFLIILVVCTVFISCTRRTPVSTVTPDNNETYRVDFLFEHDGCKVYRFQDSRNYVYFTNCNGDVTSIRSDSTEKHTINVIRNDDRK